MHLRVCEWSELQGNLSCFLYVILGEGPLGNKEWTLPLWIKGVSIILSSVFFFSSRRLIMCSLCYFGERITRQQGMDTITMDQGCFHHSIKHFSIVLEDSASKASSEGESPSAKHPIITHQLRPPFLGVHHMIIKRHFFFILDKVVG